MAYRLTSNWTKLWLRWWPKLNPTVLHIIDSFEQGGTERQALQLVRMLHANGRYRVRLACLQRKGLLLSNAEELGIGQTALRRWVAQAEVEAGRGPEGALKRSEREELAELRRENQRLRLEREILKKATAFFARESE